MRRFVSFLVVPLLMFPVAHAAEKPAPPAHVAATALDGSGSVRVTWSVGDLADGVPTGFRIYGKLADGTENPIETVGPLTRHYVAPGGYEDYGVASMVGTEESDRKYSCLVLHPLADPPVVRVKDECIPVR